MEKVDFEESQTIEFKESIGSGRWLEQAASFVNTDGGQIYFGIKKDRTVKGINPTGDKRDGISNAMATLDEPITVSFEEKEYCGKKVLIVNIPKGNSIPHILGGAIFIRSSATTRALTKAEMIESLSSAGYIRFEMQPIKNATLNDIDSDKVEYFLAKKISSMEHPSKSYLMDETLLNLGVAVRNQGKTYPTTAGVLFFGKNPQKFVSYNRITIARYKGTVPVDFIDKDDLTGTFLEMIDSCEKFIRRNTRNSAKIIDFERVEMPEYPIAAIREGIVNAVAHKEYSSKAPIQISIFDDRIEIINPGIPSVPIEELNVHMPRNETICRLLKDAKYMESFGTGIKRMKELMIRHGISEPILEVHGEFFKITFPGPKEDMLKIVKPVRRNLREEGLNDNQIIALSIIQEQGYITHKEYCVQFNVKNIDGAKELKELVDKKLAIQEGKGIESRFMNVD